MLNCRYQLIFLIILTEEIIVLVIKVDRTEIMEAHLSELMTVIRNSNKKNTEKRRLRGAGRGSIKGHYLSAERIVLCSSLVG